LRELARANKGAVSERDLTIPDPVLFLPTRWWSDMADAGKAKDEALAKAWENWRKADFT
jgi:hypothetical protein